MCVTVYTYCFSSVSFACWESKYGTWLCLKVWEILLEVVGVSMDGSVVLWAMLRIWNRTSASVVRYGRWRGRSGCCRRWWWNGVVEGNYVSVRAGKGDTVVIWDIHAQCMEWKANVARLKFFLRISLWEFNSMMGKVIKLYAVHVLITGCWCCRPMYCCLSKRSVLVCKLLGTDAH